MELSKDEKTLLKAIKKEKMDEKKERVLDPRGYYYVRPAQHIDIERGIYSVSLPIEMPKIIKGKPVMDTQIMMVTRNDMYILDEENIVEKKVFPITVPDLPVPSRWDISDAQKFQQEIGQEKLYFIDAFDMTKDIFEQLYEFSSPLYYTFVSIWAMMTYIYTGFHAVPFIFLNGTKNSGKSKIINILQMICFNSESTANTSPSALFRLIEANNATVMVDEGENLNGTEYSQELRLLLNACYVSTGTVTRTNKDSHKVERFKVFTPVCIGAINELESTLMSRCIPIFTMRSTKNSRKGKLFVDPQHIKWRKIRHAMYKGAFQSYQDIIKLSYEMEPEGIENRNLQLWKPILTIARWLSDMKDDPSIYEDMITMAQESVEESESLTQLEIYILNALYEECKVHDVYEVKKIRQKVIELNGNDGEMIRMDKIQGKTIGSIIRKFGFKKAGRTNKSVQYRISPEKIPDLFERYGLYLPSDTLTPLSTLNEAKPESAENESVQNLQITDDTITIVTG